VQLQSGAHSAALWFPSPAVTRCACVCGSRPRRAGRDHAGVPERRHQRVHVRLRVRGRQADPQPAPAACRLIQTERNRHKASPQHSHPCNLNLRVRGAAGQLQACILLDRPPLEGEPPSWQDEGAMRRSRTQHTRLCRRRACLEVPAATVGGRMAGTWKPRASSAADAASASASRPITSGTMGLAAATPRPAPSRATSRHRCRRRPGSWQGQG